MAELIPASLGSGAYTLPDAARLLDIPLPKLRRWVRGVAEIEGRHLPAGPFASRAQGRDRNFDFYTLIELFTVAELRRLGLSMSTLREARSELSQRYKVAHPFALRGLLTDGNRLLKELGDKSLLELGSGGQASFEEVIKPFCRQVHFDSISNLASRYFPLGRKRGIVVDPQHAFGRPVIEGTNLATETIAALLRGGESIDDVVVEFRLERPLVEAAWEYEQRLAA
jgi:uncharacterized protein (DUF433 family)